MLYLQNKNLLMGISNAPKVYYASSFKNVLYWDCAILNFPSKFHDLPKQHNTPDQNKHF